MPRKTGERRLDDALKALGAALLAAQARWMIIGGIAVIARGVRRMTTDIDAVVLGDAIDTGKLLRVLARHAVEPRIEGAEAFAEKNLVLLLRHVPSGVDLDLSLGWTDFEREAIASSTPAAYGRASYPMARAEDLVVFKARHSPEGYRGRSRTDSDASYDRSSQGAATARGARGARRRTSAGRTSAPFEGKRVRVVLEFVDEDVRLSAEEQARRWKAWLDQGPDGPLEDERGSVVKSWRAGA